MLNSILAIFLAIKLIQMVAFRTRMKHRYHDTEKKRRLFTDIDGTARRDLPDARTIIDRWRQHYNHVRPHSSLGYVPPAVCAQQVA